MSSMGTQLSVLSPLVIMLLSFVAYGQADAESEPKTKQALPQLQVTVEPRQVVPGEFVTVRLTVVVPTFLTQPPSWPVWHLPNIVSSAKSSGPTSTRVEGETWSGTGQVYRFAPMVPGSAQLPLEDVLVTWSDPLSGKTRQDTVKTPTISFTASLPAGAEDIKPFLAADQITLTQKLEGETESMAVGGSISRVVTATVSGGSPLMIPELFSEQAPAEISVYTDEPDVETVEQRGSLGGSRTEKMVVVAQSAGEVTLPAIRLRWYNLQTQTPEEATLEAIPLLIHGVGPVSHLGQKTLWVQILLLLMLFTVGVTYREACRAFCEKHYRRLYQHMRKSRLFNRYRIYRLIRSRDYTELMTFLVTAKALFDVDVMNDTEVNQSLLKIGESRFCDGSKTEVDSAWNHLQRRMTDLLKTPAQRKSRNPLPPLNPSRS